jgi:hypothetical protein
MMTSLNDGMEFTFPLSISGMVRRLVFFEDSLTGEDVRIFPG